MEDNKVAAFTLHPYSHQLGGHHLMLQVNREQICKPLSRREKLFYDAVPESLKEFTPYYYGLMAVQFGKGDTYTGNYVQECEYSINDFIVLENLTGRYWSPCILDLKLGQRYYTDDMSPIHVQKLKDKATHSTASVIGLKLSGMQLYNPSEKCYHFYDKFYGYSLNQDTFTAAIKEFVHDSETSTYRVDILRELVIKLKKLKAVITTLESYRFYSSSLLIIYEGQKLGDRSDCSTTSTDYSSPLTIDDRSQTDVKMIDFAKFFNDPLQYKGPDKDCIYGLTNLIDILESIVSSTLR